MGPTDALTHWIEHWLMKEIPPPRQALIVPRKKAARECISFRMTNKTFTVWRLDPGCLLYPSDFKLTNLTEYEGYDGTAPRIQARLPEDAAAALLTGWALRSPETHPVCVLGDQPDDQWWWPVVTSAGIKTFKSLRVRELGEIFDLRTGAEEDAREVWPLSLREFLDTLTPEDEAKLLAHLSSAGV